MNFILTIIFFILLSCQLFANEDEFDKLVNSIKYQGNIEVVVKDFPAEAIPFFAAIFKSTVISQFYHNKMYGYVTNPQPFDSTVQFIKSPLGQISFLSFLIASKKTSVAISQYVLYLNQYALTGNLLIKSGLTTSSLNALNKWGMLKSTEKFLTLFGGPLALGTGLFASSAVERLYTDPNFSNCIKYLVSPDYIDPTYDALSCKRAYHEYVSLRTIRLFIPDLLSLLSSSLAAGGISNSISMIYKVTTKKMRKEITGAVARKLLKRSIKSISFVFDKTNKIKALRVILLDKLTLIFVLNETIFAPLIQRPLMQNIDGNYTLKLLNEVKNTTLKLNSIGWKFSESRLKSETDYLFLLNNFQENNKRWRQFQLEDFIIANQSWADYSMNFGLFSMLSEKFYIMMGALLTEEKNENFENPITKSDPFFGIKTDEVRERINKVIHLINRELFYLRKKQSIYSSISSKEQSLKLCGMQIDHAIDYFNLPDNYEVRRLIEIQNLLIAIDLQVYLPFDDTLRFEKIAEGIRLLNHTIELKNDSLFKKHGVGEIFDELKKVLGDPDPAYSGYQFVERLFSGSDPMFGDVAKIKHPKFLYNAKVETLSDYLLASMACGPDIDREQKSFELIEQYQRENSVFGELKLFDAIVKNLKVVENVKVPFIKKKMLSKTVFMPPNIIKDMGYNPCLVNNVVRPPRMRTGAGSNLLFDIHKAKWRGEDGRVFKGIVQLIVNNIRPELVGTYGDEKVSLQMFNITRWWSKNITPFIFLTFGRMRNSYGKLIKDKYDSSVITDARYTPKVYLLSPFNLFRPSVQYEYLTDGDDNSFTSVSRSLAVGVKQSFIEELDVWYSIIHLFCTSSDHESRTKLVLNMLNDFSLSILDDKQFLDEKYGEQLKKIRHEFDKKIRELSEMLEVAEYSTLYTPLEIQNGNNSFSERVVLSSLKAIDDLFQEIVTYRLMLSVLPFNPVNTGI